MEDRYWAQLQGRAWSPHLGRALCSFSVGFGGHTLQCWTGSPIWTHDPKNHVSGLNPVFSLKVTHWGKKRIGSLREGADGTVPAACNPENPTV